MTTLTWSNKKYAAWARPVSYWRNYIHAMRSTRFALESWKLVEMKGKKMKNRNKLMFDLICIFSHEGNTFVKLIYLPCRIGKPKWIVKYRLLREMFQCKKRGVTKPKPGLHNTKNINEIIVHEFHQVFETSM